MAAAVTSKKKIQIFLNLFVTKYYPCQSIRLYKKYLKISILCKLVLQVITNNKDMYKLKFN